MFYARVVDQYVQAAEPGCSFCNAAAATADVGHIHADRRGLPTNSTDGVSAVLEGLGITAGYGYVGSCNGETLGDGAPDAPAGARDKRLLSIKRE